MKNGGKVWAVLLALLLIILVVGLGAAGWFIAGYNRAVNFQKDAEKAWADIDAMLQRRIDLVPNLVATVQGYASHEKELFENLAKSREKYFQADTKQGKIEASNELSGFLSRLLLLREAYPELKANENFLSLQDQLEGTENRIAVARTRYNEAARNLNSYSKQFFGSFFCRRARVEAVPYFEASEQAKKEVPKVIFR